MAEMFWTDLVQPRTDGGVVLQAGAVLVMGIAGVWLARRNRDLVIFVLGITVFTFALIAVRVLH